MRAMRAKLIASCMLAASVVAQSLSAQVAGIAANAFPRMATVAQLPVASSGAHGLRIVTNGVDAADCTVGGGTTVLLCLDTGSAWIAGGGGGGGNGTVTSVNMTVPAWLDVAGEPITTSGTLAVTAVTQLANLIFAGPASGGPATPGFRALAAADFATSGTPSDSTFLRGDLVWATPAGTAGSPYTRVVIVDEGGGGDYLTVEEAVAFVATQTRSDTARWIIELTPGPNHTIDVAPLAVPSYTSVRGMIPHSIYPFYGQTRLVCPALASGACVTLAAGSALVNVNVKFSGTLTGPAKAVEVIGSAAALINTTVENAASTATQAFSMIETATSPNTGLVMYYVMTASNANATNTTHVKHQNGGSVHAVDSIFGHTGGLNGIHNTSTGTVSLLRSVVGAWYSTNSDAMAAALRNDSTGKIEPAGSLWWGPTVGVIDDWHQPVRLRTFVDTPFATCSPIPSEIALDVGTTKRLCVCVATDDWDCFATTGGGIAGTLGTTDNAVPRADSTGGLTAQGSAMKIEDYVSTSPASDYVPFTPFGADSIISTRLNYVGGNGSPGVYGAGVLINSLNVGIQASGNYLKTWDGGGGNASILIGQDIFFVGETSAFPRLRRNSTALELVLADSSGWAPLNTGDVKIDSVLRLVPRAAVPVTCGDANTQGTIYNDTSVALCWCDGTTWQKLSGAGTCA